MKDQMDDIERKLQDRTNELREVQKFIKRLEQSILAELLKRFKHVFDLMSYDTATMKEYIQSRMDIVGDKFIKNNKKMAKQNDGAD